MKLRQISLPVLIAFAFPAALFGAPVKLLVTNATIITLETAQPDPIVGYMAIGDDGRIASLGAGKPPVDLKAAETLDVGGKVVMPGFLSGHSHLWQSAWRGISAGSRQWRAAIHGTFGPYFQTGDVYAFTLHGALDYLRHGITTTYNYSQNLNFSPELNYEQFQAEWDAGQRFVFGYATLATPSLDVVRKNFVDFMQRVRALPANPLYLKTNIASGGIGAASKQEFTKFEFDLMREFDLDMSMHYLEQPTTAATNHETIDRIEQANGLSPKLFFAHFIHSDDYEIAKAGAAGVGMSWNPLSNGRLANGIVDIPKYIKAGVKIGMGIDGQASADIADPFENMRMGLYGVRNIYRDPAIMQPIDVLRFHTIGTAEVMGVADKVGTLTVGKFADFLVVNAEDPDTGPASDVYATLVFACNTSNVERVYVGGKLVVDHLKTLDHDFGAVTRDVKQRVQAVRARQAQAPAKPST